MPAERVYFDTAFLFRLYWDECGAAEVRSFAKQSPRLSCAIHGQAELISTAHRKLREGSASKEEFSVVLDQIESEINSGAIDWLELTAPVLRRIHEVYLIAPSKTFLRAPDALHLACAADAGCSKIYSNDRHLLAAAPLFDLQGVNLIA